MPYQIIQPPFTLVFREMSKQELKDYARWFQESVEGRTSELEAAVRETPGYESWCADYEPASLQALGEWYATQVAVRPRSREEIAAELQTQGTILAPPAEVELTNRTFSLAMDVAMYLARTLERCHSHLRWTQFLDDRKFADYGQPVLVGFGPVPLNPVRIAVVIARGILAGKHKGSRLREVFDYWSSQAAKSQRH